MGKKNKLATIRISSGLLLTCITVLLLNAVQAQRANTYGHGLHTYEHYKSRLESNAYWNNPNRKTNSNTGSSTSTHESSIRNTPSYRDKLAMAKEEIELIEKRQKAARTIAVKGKGNMELDQEPFKTGLLDGKLQRVKKNGLWGLYNSANQTFVIEPLYDGLKQLDRWHVKVMKGSSAGAIDSRSGAFVIPPGKYSDLESTGNFFIIKTLMFNVCGVVSFNDQILLAPEYSQWRSMSNIVLLEDRNRHFVTVNPDGIITARSEYVWIANSKFGIKGNQSRFSFFNPTTGERVIAKDFKDIGLYKKGTVLVAVDDDNKSVVYNDHGRQISSTPADSIFRAEKDTTVWYIIKGDKTGIIDVLMPNGAVEALPPVYDRILSYNRAKGNAVVSLEGKLHTVPIKMHAGYTSISKFVTGLARATKNDKEFIISYRNIVDDSYDKLTDPVQFPSKVGYMIGEKQGKKEYLFTYYTGLIPTGIFYDEAGEINPVTFLSKVRDGDNWGVLSHDITFYGKLKPTKVNDSRLLLSCIYDDLDISNSKMILFKQNNKWGALSYRVTGNRNTYGFIAPKYDQITEVWYRHKTSDAFGQNCLVVFYAKKGNTTEYYTREKDKKIRKDPYSDNPAYERLGGIDVNRCKASRY